MHKIAICDDEIKILNDISWKIKSECVKQDIKAECISFSDSKELLSYMDNNVIDVLFLDIDMPLFTGMDIGRFIVDKGYKTRIIFVTSYDALVYQTFEYRPFGFIRKTFFDEEIGGVIQRLRDELLASGREIIIKKGNEIVKIPLENIYYIESEGNYINVYMTNGVEKYRETLGNIESELRNKGFVRCHKGYLINSVHINKVHSNELELVNGVRIPVGRSYDKAVKRTILELMRSIV